METIGNPNLSLLHLTKLAAIAYKDADLSRYSSRISACLRRLLRGQPYSCEVRNCPICDWKKNKEMVKRGQEAVECVLAKHPSFKIIFLDLSCGEIELSSLKRTIKDFKESFHRLNQLKVCKQIEGYLRYSRVSKVDAHRVRLHSQCIIFVRPGFYGGGSYLKCEKWTQLWKRSLRRDDAIARSKSIPPHKVDLNSLLIDQEVPIDDVEWFVEYSNQMHQCKSITYGGVVAEYFRKLQSDPSYRRIPQKRDIVEPILLQANIPEAVKRQQFDTIARMGEDKALIIAYQVAQEHETPETSRAVWKRVVQLENFYTQPDHREKIDLLAEKLGSKGNPTLLRQAERIKNCAIYYTNQLDPKFCGKRECPICQYQRQLQWMQRFQSKAREFINAFADRRWVLVTCKISQTPVAQIRQTLKHVNASLQRLMQLKVIGNNNVGWIRATSVVPALDVNEVNIEAKILIAFKKGFFGKNYISCKLWNEFWQQSLRRSHSSEVTVNHLKLLVPSVLVDIVGEFAQEVDFSLLEGDAFVELTQQMRNLRSISMGGEVRNFFREVKLQRLPNNWEEYFEYQISNQSGGRVRKPRN